MYKEAKLTKKEHDWSLFKIKRNEVKKLIHQAKELYINEKLDDEKSDPKRFWRSLNELTGFGRSKSRKGLSNIVSENSELLDGKEAANFMNNYYTNAGPNLASKFDDNWSENQCKINCNSTFSFAEISEEYVSKLCSEINLSKSSAMGFLSTRILKDAFVGCISELTHLFNACLQKGFFPLSWGIGEITPILKITIANKKPENWRPITQIKLPGKLLERCIHTQIFSYLDVNKLLSNQQHNFVPKKSTATAVFDMLRNVYKNWNDNLYTVCTFIDFSRAFDTIDHDILLRKLKLYGFDAKSINFMSSYLGSRRQYTVVGGFKSEVGKVTYGIAQGSIIGPLIYILYANDVFYEIKDRRAVLMYADDTLLISTGTSMTHCIQQGQIMLDNIIKWCDLNKLTINVKKTKGMIVKRDKEPCPLKMYINGEAIDFVNSFEYLGIHIDHNLSMNNHADSVYKKCISKLSTLYKIRSFISRKTALLIYKTMIRPYMDYGDFIIDSALISKTDKLERLQERILRLIEYCPVKENRKDMNVLLDSFNIESLYIRRKRNILKLMYDQSHDPDNLYTTECDINLLSSNKVKMKSQFTRLTKVKKSPFYIGIELWDKLPHEFQNEPSRIKFKSELKRYKFA